MTPNSRRSWIDELSFVERNLLKVARATASFKQPYLASFNKEGLDLNEPKVVNLDNFQLVRPNYTNNECFEDFQSFAKNSFSIFSSILEPAKSHDLCTWQVPEIADALLLYCNTSIELQEISFQSCDIYSFEEFIQPIPIEDHTSIVGVSDWIATIQDIHFILGQSVTKGKSYIKKESTKNKSSYEADKEDGKTANPNKEIVSKDKQRKSQFNANDILDLFDLIFPVLQPHLGTEFNNLIALPYDLYPFQREGVRFLTTNTSALLGDEMGLGKSIQTIVAVKLLFRQGKIFNCLFVCPKAVMSDWEKKLWEWSPELKVVRVEGDKNKRTLYWNAKSHIYLCTYETLRNDFAYSLCVPKLQVTPTGHILECSNRKCKLLLSIVYEHHNNPSISLNCPNCGQVFTYPFGGDIARTRFDVIVYDEIQKIKNSSTDSSKAARLPYGTYRWALSGTPFENKLNDLISVFTTIKSDIFKEVDITDEEQVKKAFKPFFKRRRQIDVLKDLPSVITKDVWLDLSPSQRKSYDLAERQGIAELTQKGDATTVQHIFALITQLKQICNFDPVTKESVKLEYLESDLERLVAQGDKALVFSQYVGALRQIAVKVAQYSPLIYEGSLSTSQRQIYENKFQDQTENSVMLVSLKAGNAGITLTRANYVFHFDLWWNPAVSAQAVGRAQRIGQTKTVFERKLLTNDTIEKRIYDVLASKKNSFNRIVDDLSDTESLNSILSTEDLFGLFGLSWKSKKMDAKPSSVLPDHYSNPIEFEEYISALFTRLGYMTKLTKKSHDGGVDIYAKKATHTGYDNVIIQCKHKEDVTKSVGVDVAHALYGVLQADKSYHKGILVTNGRFSSDCKAFVQGKTLELVDGTMILGLSEKLG